jgi:hypothetical protein
MARPKFIFAVLAVLGTLSTVLWVWSVVTSKHHHPLNFWAVIVLAILAAAALVWGWQQRSASTPPVTHHHHYSAPVTWGTETVQQSGFGQAVVPQPAPIPAAARTVVRLADLIEFPPDGPPVIRNRRFQNAILRGPILLAPHRVGFVRVSFGIANNDPETMLFELPVGVTKIAVAVLEDCLLEDCQTEHVAFIGTRDMLDQFRNEVQFS